MLPFFEEYVVKYSSKYRTSLFEDFRHIITRLDLNKKKTMQKEELIELVKLTSLLNPDGKGKQRKRTLEEILEIINTKS